MFKLIYLPLAFILRLMKRAIVFTFFLLFLLDSYSLNAAVANPNLQFYFKQLDNRTGLSNSSINAILQDNEQLLWVGTWDGLNRYSGANFSVYNHSIDKATNSIGGNVVQAINEDKIGNIWINTIGGVSRYEKKTGKFYRYFYKTAISKRVSENEFEIAINAKGDVFCYGTDGWLRKYHKDKDSFIEFQKIESKSAIVKMAFHGGLLWCLNSVGQLNAFEVGQKGLLLKQNFRNANKISSFFEVNGQIIYSVNDTHYLIDRNFKQSSLNVSKKRIKSIVYYQSNYIIAWENQGVSIYDEYFRPSNFLKSDLNKLENLKLSTLKVGNDEILWVGTDGNGLIQIYPKRNYFGLLTDFDSKAMNKPTRAFSEIDGNLWVGTKGNGILIYNDFWQHAGKNKNQQKLDVTNGLTNNSVFAIKKGIDDLVYLGTDGDGISVYNQKTKKVVQWKDIKGTAKLTHFKSVYAIIQDKDSSVWLGTSGYGLLHLKLKNVDNQYLEVASFKQYLSSAKEKNGPANDIIYALARGKDSRLWIACRYGGLSVFETKKKSFKTYKALGSPGSLSHSDVLSLYYDSKDRLWIGTSFGLNMLTLTQSKADEPVFSNITTENGLPNNTIHAIQEDELGKIWLSTNRGLAKLNPTNNAIANYLESDGLQSNEFSDGAVYRTANNVLLFGGIYGFNFFNPKFITGNAKQPNLFIYDLQFGGKALQNNQFLIVNAESKQFQSYEIERKNNFFQFSFNALNFFNASKSEFAYKLKGLDQAWRFSGSDGKIAYYNIPPGNYDLLVRWSNGEGVWTEDVIALHIDVSQYFWLTIPAYICYFLLLVASVYAFHLYRKNKLEMKFKLERETLFRQKDDEIHRQRINFFTNIAHEIQTPLTLILGSVEHFIQKQHEPSPLAERSNFLSLVHQHTARLTYLVQQLLEFRKAEAGYVKRNDDYLDISKMLLGLTQLFMPVAEKNNQVFVREIPKDIASFIDKDKYEKILFNLLSNAFKYTDAGESILFKVDFEKETNTLKTIVANSGSKLKETELADLFTEFHVGNDNQFEKFSTGIGLAFTKELISILDGDIQVYLKDGWIYFDFILQLNSINEGKSDEVVTSTPSYLFESILKPYEQDEVETIIEGNKNTLIEDLQEKAEHSVLIVEDDVALRFLLKNILKDHYNVYEAENGQTALEFLKHNMPSIIISDVMMPDMDGLAFCKYVKSAPATNNIPFILLTARGSDEQKTEGYEIGADAYIPKPFHINYLKVRIRKLLEYRKRMDNLIKDGNINNHFVNVDLEQGDKEFLNALVKAVEQNLAEPDLDASKLEEALHISKMQLYRKLKTLAGMTPSEFIKRIRLKHAAMLLQSSKLTVSEIFYRTGFNNKSYFFREFKKIYHLAPNDYRLKQHDGSATSEIL